ncbi:MAG: haloacid dehalogenase type II [Saprospiraceae bacterium]|nr:haloacid dehalogenase type II [Saprospiraceae bacterium]
MNPVEAIVFDAYGTLFDVQSIQRKLEKLYNTRAASIGQVWRQKQLEYTWLRTLMQRYVPFTKLTQDALLYACEANGVNAQPEEVNQLMEAYNQLDVFTEVHAALQQLSQQVPLAILSNANQELLDRATTYNQIKPYFKDIISVDAVEQFKTVPTVYQLAVDRLKVSAERVVFVSSNTWDVAGAKSFGLQVVWVKRKQDAIVEQLGFPPDHTIEQLGDLSSLFFS